MCINIGDATRKIGDQFNVLNHSRITSKFINLGFQPLQYSLEENSNAPNKFMGSGMLPAGAYVTLEHEYTDISQGKREFRNADEKGSKQIFFWEERNRWFLILGFKESNKQQMMRACVKEMPYPFELPYRLVNMYSVKVIWFLILSLVLHNHCC